MAINLVVVDHHQLVIDLKNYPNVEVVKASSLKDFFSKSREWIKKDYDLVISDEDPDGITSTIIYALYKGGKINFRGNRSGLNKNDISVLKDYGIKDVIAFDWYAFSYSEIKEFDKIIYLNPKSSNLPNVNTSDIVFNALPETGRFGRDISAIGTVCDYCVEECYDKIKAVILEYKELFPELVQLALDNKVNRYNIYEVGHKKTKFYDLSLMFWAPFILHGVEGNDTIIRLVTQNRGFSLRDLFKGSSNMAVSYLRGVLEGVKTLIDEEKKSFMKEKKEIGDLVFYEVKTNKSGFMSKFSSVVRDELDYGKVVVLRSKVDENNIVKYSLRTIKKVHNLGLLLTNLGVGGGHEEAAGATMNIDKVEWFEKELVKAISPFSLPK